MKKYYLALISFFILCYLLPLALRPLLQLEYLYAYRPLVLLESGHYPWTELPWFSTAWFFNWFGVNSFALRLSSALSTGLLTLLLMLLMKKCTNDKAISLFSGLFYLTGAMVFYFGTTANSAAAGQLFNAAALGTFFMAFRENRFSLQRINLLLLCGLCSSLAFLIDGLQVFVLPLTVVIPFLLWEKRYFDLLVMPLIPLAAGLLLLALWGVYVLDGSNSREVLTLIGFTQLGDQFGMAGLEFLRPWSILVAGLFPGAIFIVCALQGYRKRVREVLSQSVYRFAFCMMVMPLLLLILLKMPNPADVLIFYLGGSVLLANGLVHYLRSSNHHSLLAKTFSVLALFFLGMGIYCLVEYGWRWNELYPLLALCLIFWAFFLLWSIRQKIEVRILVFYLGLCPLLFIATRFIPAELDEFEVKSALAIGRDPGRQSEILADEALFYPVAYCAGSARIGRWTGEEPDRSKGDTLLFLSNDNSEALSGLPKSIRFRSFIFYSWPKKHGL